MQIFIVNNHKAHHAMEFLQTARGSIYPAQLRLSRGGHAAFTLIEVVVSSAVFVMAGMGILSGMLFAYHTTIKTRTHDQAWVVLRTFADQFTDSRQDCFVDSTRTAYNSLWEPTQEFTGVGLSWPGSAAATTEGLTINLDYPGSRGSSGTVLFKVQRRVVAVSSLTDSGTVPTGNNPDLLLRATFLTTYTLQGHTFREEITVTRSARF